jgi:hypothetical protein
MSQPERPGFGGIWVLRKPGGRKNSRLVRQRLVRTQFDSDRIKCPLVRSAWDDASGGTIGRGIVKKNTKWCALWIGCSQLNPVVIPGHALRLTVDGSAARRTEYLDKPWQRQLRTSILDLDLTNYQIVQRQSFIAKYGCVLSCAGRQRRGQESCDADRPEAIASGNTPMERSVKSPTRLIRPRALTRLTSRSRYRSRFSIATGANTRLPCRLLCRLKKYRSRLS